MGRLTDPERLQCYLNALANCRFTGFIELRPRVAEWLRQELGMSERAFKNLLFTFVSAGGEIDEIAETRPEWSDFDHHYDLRPIVAGKAVYVETLLMYSKPTDPDDPRIAVVNVHWT